MARSLNKAQLIGNLTRDPELRYTPSGAAVCSFSIATNRSWTTDTGEKHEESDFHRIVAWNKLGEICSQYLVKGRKVYVEGRLSTRNWTSQDGQNKSVTEIVIDDMIILDKTGTPVGKTEEGEVEAEKPAETSKSTKPKKEEKVEVEPEHTEPVVSSTITDEVAPDDIPF